MTNKIHLHKTSLCITQRCTLHCKLCAGFIPYYKNPCDTPFEILEKSIVKYFSIVDDVKNFTVTGGEPLMHPDFKRILDTAYQYADQVLESVDIVTNCTLDFAPEILDLLQLRAAKSRVVLSDYGPDLSIRFAAIHENLVQRQIPFRVSKFHGLDLYYDGWGDFTDHTLKHETLEKRNAQGRRCLFKTGRYFTINEGFLMNCSRAVWRTRQGIIPRLPEEHLELLNEDITIKEHRRRLSALFAAESVASCAYCHGLHSASVRHYPAEQLPSHDQLK